MAAHDPDTDHLVEITRRAAEIASHAPEHLQEAAFNRVFDQLSGGGSGISDAEGAPGEKQSRRGRRSATRGASGPSTEKDATDPAAILINSVSRTDHPEITGSTRALDRALHLLRLSESEYGIEGMTAPQIAKVLTDKFREPVSRQAIGQALDAAGKYVDRTPRPGREAAIFRLMAPGEAYLDAGGAASKDEAKSERAPRTQRTRTSRPRAKAKANKETTTSAPARRRSGRGPKSLIEDLIAEGFFSEPRAIGAIQERLRHKKGVQFKPTDLSPALVRLLRQNKLDRERNQSNQYEYSVPS